MELMCCHSSQTFAFRSHAAQMLVEKNKEVEVLCAKVTDKVKEVEDLSAKVLKLENYLEKAESALETQIKRTVEVGIICDRKKEIEKLTARIATIELKLEVTQKRLEEASVQVVALYEESNEWKVEAESYMLANCDGIVDTRWGLTLRE